MTETPQRIRQLEAVWAYIERGMDVPPSQAGQWLLRAQQSIENILGHAPSYLRRKVAGHVQAAEGGK